jgi:hypothetical protein
MGASIDEFDVSPGNQRDDIAHRDIKTMLIAREVPA